MSCVAHYEQPAPRLLRTSPIFWTLTNTNVSAIRVNILSNSRKFATPYQQRKDDDGLHRGRAHPLGQPRAGEGPDSTSDQHCYDVYGGA